MSPKYLVLIIFSAFVMLSLAAFAFLNKAKIAENTDQNRKVVLNRPDPTPGMDINAQRGSFVSYVDSAITLNQLGSEKKFKVDGQNTIFSCMPSVVQLQGGGTGKLTDAFIDISKVDINKDPRFFAIEKFITIEDISTKVNKNSLVIYITETPSSSVGPYKQKFVFTDCN